MSRILKFRAWDEKNKSMRYDLGVIDGETLNAQFEDQYYQFMQFTGLYDKNGKEIYEGDLLEFYSKSLLDDGELQRRVGIIEWNAEHLRWDVLLGDKPVPNLCKSIDDNQFLIIGDRYTNPELLK